MLIHVRHTILLDAMLRVKHTILDAMESLVTLRFCYILNTLHSILTHYRDVFSLKFDNHCGQWRRFLLAGLDWACGGELGLLDQDNAISRRLIGSEGTSWLSFIFQGARLDFFFFLNKRCKTWFVYVFLYEYMKEKAGFPMELTWVSRHPAYFDHWPIPPLFSLDCQYIMELVIIDLTSYYFVVTCWRL